MIGCLNPYKTQSIPSRIKIIQIRPKKILNWPNFHNHPMKQHLKPLNLVKWATGMH